MVPAPVVTAFICSPVERLFRADVVGVPVFTPFAALAYFLAAGAVRVQFAANAPFVRVLAGGDVLHDIAALRAADVVGMVFAGLIRSYFITNSLIHKTGLRFKS